MKKLLLSLLFIISMSKLFSQIDYSKYPAYDGKGLGLTYTKAASSFRIWSPPAAEVQMLLYKEGTGGEAFKTIHLTKNTSGTWFVKLPGNWQGTFYTFRVKINEQWSNDVPDPYAKAVGVNGKRAMVANLKETNPAGWANDKSPAFSIKNNAVDAVIYELHIRDASIHANAGIKNKGKFAGLAETGTTSSDVLSTGLDHIKELGATHVHLLPFFDFNSVDESKTDKIKYNWGYDPLNYNVPEGSYSSNPYDGITRIKELKQMIAAFHKKGLRVVMDVVYNHVADVKTSSFNQLVPGYYFRHKKDNSFSDATACGNETASEMPMMRKFMLESVLYWAKEYHLDGFRFDLMGVHDIETMNLISKALHQVKPDILLYGEGWTAGASPLPDAARALKKNAYLLDRIAVFNDDIRDGIKGSVFEEKDRGFASGKPGMEESVKFGITAACGHPQVDLKKVNYSKEAYAAAPGNTITYCECHDNNTLWDKLKLSYSEATTGELKKMQELALSIVLTSQGIPFLHAGTEFLRNKKGVENSYNAGDSINAIDWALKKKNYDVFLFVKKLITIRKAHPAFRMTTTAQIKNNIQFNDTVPEGTIAYTINGAAMKDSWKKISVAFNGSKEQKNISLPKGKWKVGIDSEGSHKQVSGDMVLAPYSSIILYQE